ncbi:hypothetical protein [Natronococcus sp.]|uniref:hypothetical protein n=1 Tax=Natronococcus sp. TaxID=35747 RepID=UPI0025DE39AA|nr:hypothetical protein [Natronococcus sp.]
MDKPKKSMDVFVLEMGFLLLAPPLALGAFLAVLGDPGDFLPGFGVGLIVGVGAASLRNEIRGARDGSEH